MFEVTVIGFRPLAGVNYNDKHMTLINLLNGFPSPCGGEL